MKPIVGALALVTVLGLSTAALGASGEDGSSAARSMVRGQVTDPERNPVSGVDVILLSEEGQEISRTSTNASGTYSLGCVELGKYQYEIVPAKGGFKGHKVVAPLGPNGLTLDWAVDQNKPALASAMATGGPCGGAVVGAAAGGAAVGAAGATGAGAGGTAAIAVGGAALVGGAGVGIAAGAGAFDSDDSGTPAQ